jgi:tRNA splicing ligase
MDSSKNADVALVFSIGTGLSKSTLARSLQAHHGVAVVAPDDAPLDCDQASASRWFMDALSDSARDPSKLLIIDCNNTTAKVRNKVSVK